MPKMPSPIMTATFQAVGLSTASNIIAQFIEAYQGERPLALDFVRLGRFVLLTFITTPPNYQWQQLLERAFPAYAPNAPERPDVEKGAMIGEVAQPVAKPRLNIRNTLTKWFVDCITLGALLNTVAFLVIMGMMKRQTAAQIADNIRTETIPIIVASYKIWPLASIISFTFVSVERRIVFLSFIGLLWGIYMSLVASNI